MKVDFSKLGINQKYVIAYLKFIAEEPMQPKEIENALGMNAYSWVSKVCNTLMHRRILDYSVNDKGYYAYFIDKDVEIENFDSKFDNETTIDWSLYEPIKYKVNFDTLGKNQKLVYGFLKYIKPNIGFRPCEIEKELNLSKSSGWASKVCNTLNNMEILKSTWFCDDNGEEYFKFSISNKVEVNGFYADFDDDFANLYYKKDLTKKIIDSDKPKLEIQILEKPTEIKNISTDDKNIKDEVDENVISFSINMDDRFIISTTVFNKEELLSVFNSITNAISDLI